MVELRWARASDARALHVLQQGIYDEERFFVYDKPISEYHLRQHLRHLDRHKAFYMVALVDTFIAGYIELSRLRSRKLQHNAMLTIAVAPAYRQQGIGRKLLQESYRWCRNIGVSRIELDVRARNQSAIALYEHEGFVLEGRKVNHVRINADTFEDCILMAKSL